MMKEESGVSSAQAWGCPCRRYVTADAMGMAKVRGKLEGEECRWCRNRVGNKHGERHHDVPRFGALLRDNTPTPACFFYINASSYNNSSLSTQGKVSAAVG